MTAALGLDEALGSAVFHLELDLYLAGDEDSAYALDRN